MWKRSSRCTDSRSTGLSSARPAGPSLLLVPASSASSAQCSTSNRPELRNIAVRAATLQEAPVMLSPRAQPAQPYQHLGNQHHSQAEWPLSGPHQSWLHQAVPHLVRQLSTGQPDACLQIVHSSSFRRLSFEYKPLTGQDIASSEVWKQVARASSSDGTMAVVLARPIPDPSQVCPLTSSSYSAHSQAAAPAQGATDSSCTGVSNSNQAGAQSAVELQGSVDVDNCCSGQENHSHSHHAASSHTTHSSHEQHQHQQGVVQALARRFARVEDMSGSDSSNSGGTSGSDNEFAAPAMSATPRSRRRFLRRQQTAQQRHQADSESHNPLSGGHAQTSYYGLAVQSVIGAVSAGHSDGCYVLKLSRNKDLTGCTCTVFSLTRVCRGQPLYSQLNQSWLA